MVEIENEPGRIGSIPAGTCFKQVLFPSLSHMDMVLRPTPALLEAVVGAIAGAP